MYAANGDGLLWCVLLQINVYQSLNMVKADSFDSGGGNGSTHRVALLH